MTTETTFDVKAMTPAEIRQNAQALYRQAAGMPPETPQKTAAEIRAQSGEKTDGGK